MRWLALLLTVIAFAERLPLRIYTTADGLGSTVINRIVRDSRGYLWFCTREGLSRFDGYRFATYGVADGLPNASINDILETGPGEYWIATNGGGVCRFRPGGGAARFEVFRTGATAASNRVNVLFRDRSGRLWAGADEGLFLHDDSQQSAGFRDVEPGPQRMGILAMAQDREGSLWVGTGKGLARLLPDGSMVTYHLKPTLGGDRVGALLADREGRMWAGHMAGLMMFLPPPAAARKLSGTRWYTRADGLPSDYAATLLERRDGSLWIGTTDGLAEMRPTGVRAYGKPEGLGGVASGLEEDSAGNLWVGNTAGAVRWMSGGFTSFGESDSPGLKDILSLLETPAGELLAVDGEWGVHPFNGKAFWFVRPNLPANLAQQWGDQGGYLDRSGNWWIPTHVGLSRFASIRRGEPTKRLALYTRQDGLPDDNVYRVFEDSRGKLWIGTRGSSPGLAFWERATGSFRAFSSRDGLGDGLDSMKWPSAFCEDRSGAVWIGFSEGGLARYHQGRFRRLTEADGVPAGQIWAGYVDRAGRLWVGSSQGGLARIDDPAAERPNIKRYTTREGLSSNYIRAITEDRWGRIYLATARGVNRLEPASGRVTHFTVQDGLANDFVTSAFCDRQGILWFGTREGFSRLAPEREALEPPPPVYIDGLRIGGAAWPVSAIGDREIAGLELRADQSQLQIDFVGLGFGVGERLRYQFRLEGADTDWGPPTGERTTYYARLAPGRYRFQVRAVSATGLASAEPAAVAFTILPPVWRRGWFLALATALAVLSAFALHRYRLARLLEVERVRTRIATDLHDDIGASLARIAILSDLAKQAEIAESARELMDNMSDVVWSIDPRRDTLGSLVIRIRRFASDMLESRGITFDFETPPEAEKVRLTPEQRRHIFLILKEAVNNAARHAGCAAVSLSLRMADHQLLGRIYDDGRGFDEEPGHGLENMRARAEGLGGSFQVDSTPGRGTSLVFRVPL